MTKLGEEVMFSPECVNKFFRLPIVCDGANFLVNTARNSVSCIQAKDRKLLQTWTLKHPHSFTAPLAFCSTDNTICCVKDNTAFVVWTHVDENLEKVSEIELNHQVFAILPVEHVCVIVFTNGLIRSLNDIKSSDPNERGLEVGEEMIWTNAVSHDGDVLIACLVKHKNENSYTLRNYILKENSCTVTSLGSQTLEQTKLRLLSICLQVRMDGPSVLIMWSDGELHSHDLFENGHKKMICISELHSDTAVCIDAINGSHVAVAKIASKHKKESVIEIWDLNYGVLKETKLLKHRFQKQFQMKTFESSIFLSSTEGLIMISLMLETSTLSSVVGISTTTDEGKSYVWNDDGMLKVEMTEHTNSTNKCPFTDFTSKSFLDIVEKSTEDDFHKLCTEIVCQTEMTEDELVTVLKACLRRCRNESEDTSQIKLRLEILLNAIFKVQFTDIYLSQNLKRLNFEDTLTALHALLKIVQSHLFCGENSQVPSDLQVVKWMELLMHTHFDDLVMTNDKKVLQLLETLRHTFAEKMQVYSELEDIRNFLLLLKKKTDLPEKSMHSKYCIETLYL